MRLTQFDSARNAVIDPEMMHQRVPGFPESLVSVFSHQLFKAVLEFLGGRVIAEAGDVDGILAPSPVKHDWTRKKRSPCWPLNWLARSRKGRYELGKGGIVVCLSISWIYGGSWGPNYYGVFFVRGEFIIWME